MAETQVSEPIAETLPFGSLADGKAVEAIILRNKNGMTVKILTYGAIISECWVPDRNGALANVVLGFADIEGYLGKHPRFGSTIGRYANRIAGAEFELDGRIYKLAANKGSTCIHGGNLGFDKRIWQLVDLGQNQGIPDAKLSYFSADMEEGFPGNLSVEITFSLYGNNALCINYKASTDKATPINLTNHSYFNLKGAGNGNILDHIASFNASQYTQLNEESLPTGKILPVDGTAFDFRNARQIGARIHEAVGYDLNYVVDRSESGFESPMATVVDPASGRALSTFSDQPGFQFFTANSLDGSICGNGGKYERYAGFCIETQHFPDSVHHDNFPTTVLKPGETFNSYTRYEFGNFRA